jgi:hypothetical protein
LAVGGWRSARTKVPRPSRQDPLDVARPAPLRFIETVVRFLTRSRLYDDDEWRALQAEGPPPKGEQGAPAPG